MLDDLPMCCRTCAHKQSQYLYPAWSHRCARAKPMVEGCRWKTGRSMTLRETRDERKDH